MLNLTLPLPRAPTNIAHKVQDQVLWITACDYFYFLIRAAVEALGSSSSACQVSLT